MHVHIVSPQGEAKFWVEPTMALDDYKGLSARQLRELERVVKEHVQEIIQSWKKHFTRR